MTSGARNLLINQPWTGNVRELQNTLLRACVMTHTASISENDLRKSLFVLRPTEPDNILNRRLGEDFSLPELVGELARHYLQRAIKEAGDNKSKAAKSLGLANYQTFDNWLEKYK